ncbi:hypothetical protein H0194_02500 [Corynebacterium incognita]|uniref:Uncharacterized protein n=1 Tax=Corynebacterium incognita TaxID=2754725 RepID=A0A7G7CQQ9_9CORY|nr:hypothetical protein [Corynebacterium incognita]QNE89925.1 hypothetical protein H0194_02500 [Corynebacterium incognita]
MTTCVAHEAVRGSYVTAPDHGAAGVGGSEHAEPAVTTGVLTVRGCPKRLRPAIERAMATCVRTESRFVVLGDDPLFAQWHTRWWKDRCAAGSTAKGVYVACRQVLTGTPAELDNLRVVVETLADEFQFTASVDAAGPTAF